MLTVVGLLVYAVIQRQLRLSLRDHDRHIPGNKGPTAIPTAAVVFALFMPVTLVTSLWTMRPSCTSMASRRIISSFMKPWVLTRPGIKERQRGKNGRGQKSIFVRIPTARLFCRGGICNEDARAAPGLNTPWRSGCNDHHGAIWYR
jgi:hypothetical protein